MSPAPASSPPRRKLQILILEDRPADAELVARELQKQGFDIDWQRVDTERDFRLRLTPRLDVVLADYHVPGFGALAALQAVRESGLDVPVVVVSGSIGDEKAAECLKEGASDYILKDRPARLGQAVERAVHERKAATEQRRLQDALTRSEEQLRTILGTVEDVVWSMSLEDWKMVYMNPAGETMFGRPVEDFYRDGQLWTQSVHPEDRQRMLELQKAMIQWGTGEGEMRVVRPDGSLRDVLTRAWCAYGPDGEPVRLEGICTDVTEKKAREEDLRRKNAALEEAQAMARLGSWEWDAAADGSTLSAEAWRIWDMRPGSAKGTSSFLAKVHPADRGPFEQAMRRAVQDGTPYDVSVRIRTSQGERHTRHRGRVAARDADGRPVRLVGTIEDVTEKRRAEEERLELERSRHEAERLAQLNTFKTNFLNMAAHDLNNAVMPIQLGLETLRSSLGPALPVLPPAVSQSLSILQRSANRVTGFLGDLLDAARSQAGNLRIQKAPVDLSQLLSDAVEAARLEATPRGLTLTTSIPPGLRLEADARRVEQVATNLLGNAVKFTPNGGAIQLRLSVSPGAAQVEVTDTGPGIREADFPKLFQPFSQIGTKAQGKHTGTGLGLFICKGIVEAHGGRVWCESKEGAGSTFSFTLPREAAPAAPAASPAPSAPAQPPPTPSPPKEAPPPEEAGRA